MSANYILFTVNEALRRGDVIKLQTVLARLLKQINDPLAASRHRAELELERVKILRVLNRTDEATYLCETSISNIPANSVDILAALKRVRTLLFLDVGDTASARELIDETDGLELVLQGGARVINRDEHNVSVETWLVSLETALTQNDLYAAQSFFDKAVQRLSVEEGVMRRNRYSSGERLRLTKYYQDIADHVHLYSLALRLYSGDITAGSDAHEFLVEVRSRPNFSQPLQSKLMCLIGQRPSGNVAVPEAEIIRWLSFASPVERLSPELVPHKEDQVESANEKTALLPFDDQSSEPTAGKMEAVFDKFGNVLEQLNNLFPAANNLLNGNPNLNFSERGFGGHVLDVDLHTLLQNAARFTGFIRFNWSPGLYQRQVVKGILPDIVETGEATLYLWEGVIIDAVFRGQNTLSTVESARHNMLLLTRLCFSIACDNVKPDILARATVEPAVAERPRLISVGDMDLFSLTVELEDAAAGIKPTMDETESGATPSHSTAELDPATVSADELLLEI